MTNLTMGFGNAPLRRPNTNNEYNQSYRYITPNTVTSYKTETKHVFKSFLSNIKNLEKFPRTPGTNHNVEKPHDDDETHHNHAESLFPTRDTKINDGPQVVDTRQQTCKAVRHSITQKESYIGITDSSSVDRLINKSERVMKFIDQEVEEIFPNKYKSVPKKETIMNYNPSTNLNETPCQIGCERPSGQTSPEEQASLFAEAIRQAQAPPIIATFQEVGNPQEKYSTHRISFTEYCRITNYDKSKLMCSYGENHDSMKQQKITQFVNSSKPTSSNQPLVTLQKVEKITISQKVPSKSKKQPTNNVDILIADCDDAIAALNEEIASIITDNNHKSIENELYIPTLLLHNDTTLQKSIENELYIPTLLLHNNITLIKTQNAIQPCLFKKNLETQLIVVDYYVHRSKLPKPDLNRLDKRKEFDPHLPFRLT